VRTCIRLVGSYHVFGQRHTGQPGTLKTAKQTRPWRPPDRGDRTARADHPRRTAAN
jgi:hypothetical protein